MSTPPLVSPARGFEFAEFEQRTCQLQHYMHDQKIDAGANFDGYFSDFDRNYGFGHVTPDTVDAYEAVYTSTEAGLNIVAPGRTTGAVWLAMWSFFSFFLFVLVVAIFPGFYIYFLSKYFANRLAKQINVYVGGSPHASGMTEASQTYSP